MKAKRNVNASLLKQLMQCSKCGHIFGQTKDIEMFGTCNKCEKVFCKDCIPLHNNRCEFTDGN